MQMNEAAAAASFLSASVQECRRGWNLNCRRQAKALIELGFREKTTISPGKMRMGHAKEPVQLDSQFLDTGRLPDTALKLVCHPD